MPERACPRLIEVAPPSRQDPAAKLNTEVLCRRVQHMVGDEEWSNPGEEPAVFAEGGDGA